MVTGVYVIPAGEAELMGTAPATGVGETVVLTPDGEIDATLTGRLVLVGLEIGWVGEGDRVDRLKLLPITVPVDVVEEPALVTLVIDPCGGMVTVRRLLRLEVLPPTVADTS